MIKIFIFNEILKPRLQNLYLQKGKASDWAVEGKGRKGDSIGGKLGRKTRGR